MTYGIDNAETQLLSMSVGLRSHFDFNEVLAAGVSGAALEATNIKLANTQSLSANKYVDNFERNLIRQEASVLSEGAIESILTHHEFDLEMLENDPVNSYGAATQAKNAQYARKMNQFGMFGGKQTPNQAQYTEQKFKTILEKREFAQAFAQAKPSNPRTNLPVSTQHSISNNEKTSVFSLSKILEPVNSATREILSTFSGKTAPSYYNMANNYYAGIVSNTNQSMALNTHIELESTSFQVPSWQSEKTALMNNIGELANSARSWNTLGMMSDTVGILGNVVGPAAEIYSGLEELKVEPTYRNTAVILGGAAGGTSAMNLAEGLVFGESAPDLALATLAAPEIVLPAIGFAAVGAAGFFAGRAITGYAYDKVVEINEEVRKWMQPSR